MATTGRVKISDLKAHLSAYLRRAQRGLSVTVLDRDTPIAVISPPPESTRSPRPVIRKGRGRLRSIVSQPALSVRTDSLAVLVEDRSRR